MHACMCICVYTYVDMWVYTYVCMCVCVCLWCMCVCKSLYVYTFCLVIMCIYLSMPLCICVFVYVCLCIWVCIHICVGGGGKDRKTEGERDTIDVFLIFMMGNICLSLLGLLKILFIIGSSIEKSEETIRWHTNSALVKKISEGRNLVVHSFVSLNSWKKGPCVFC